MRVLVRATPGARRPAIGGAWRGPDGETRLVARVSAPPDKGRANAALTRALAEAFGVPVSAAAIASGEKDRLKTFEIIGDEAILKARLEELLGETKR